jgi:RNA polymerase sigma-70 factor (ECF subfamily)
MTAMAQSWDNARDLMARLRRQDETALADLFSVHWDRLWRMVDLRLDARLRPRLWPEDVLHEAHRAAHRRIVHIAEDGFEVPFVWLRMVVHQTLIDLHRRYLGIEMRAVGREVSRDGRRFAPATPASLAVQLMVNWAAPAQAAVRSERLEAIRRTLEEWEPLDREILALRRFERLRNREIAEELGIEPKAARIRYARALRRLRQILGAPRRKG